MPNGVTRCSMADQDPRDFTALYNTALSSDEEPAFQHWVGEQSKATGKDISNDLYDYDLRGWWQQNPGENLKGGHLTDKFKKPNHPTFSTISQYHDVNGM